MITSILPPMISQHFDRYLLDPLMGIVKKIENKIIPLAKRKIRDQDTGKRKEFDILLSKVGPIYERKKVEEKDYQEKIKNAKKRPSIPTSSGTSIFRRPKPKE